MLARMRNATKSALRYRRPAALQPALVTRTVQKPPVVRSTQYDTAAVTEDATPTVVEGSPRGNSLVAEMQVDVARLRSSVQANRVTSLSGH